MTPKYQNKRIAIVIICAIFLFLGMWLLLNALNRNTQFFYNPSEITMPGFEAKSDQIRVGGLVLNGSIVKNNKLSTSFRISDFPENDNDADDVFIKVSFEGILPDLFREGQGVVVTGQLVSETELVASEILAKHDENYQPKKN